MVRIFLLSVVFFIIQVIIVIHASPLIYDSLLDLDIRYLTFEKRQRAAITHIQKLKKNNTENIKTVYILGGSSGREYFKHGDEIDSLVPLPLVNLCSAQQNLLDSIRLMDNINVPGSVVILTFPPFKLMTHSKNMLSSTKYLMGNSLKYPIESQTLDALLKDVKPANLTTALMPSLNAVIYLAKNYLNHKKDLFLSEKIFTGRGLWAFGNLRHMFKNSIPPPYYFYVTSKPVNRQELRQGLTSFRDTTVEKKLSENLETNLSYLESLVRIAKKKNIQLILYELPYSQTGLSIFATELETYQTEMNTFLQQHSDILFFKVEYSRYDGKETLFHDHVHLTTEGREYFHPYVRNMFNQVFTNES